MADGELVGDYVGKVVIIKVGGELEIKQVRKNG